MDTTALVKNLGDNPEDVESYLVYSDALQAAGDPRGLLIAIEEKRERDVFLAEHADALLGDLAEFVERDFLELDWFMGFIRGAKLVQTYDDFEEEWEAAEKCLTALLASPSTAFLQHLTLGLLDFEGDNDYGDVFTRLAERPRPSLRSVFIGSFEFPEDTEISWSQLGDPAPLWAAAPNLRSVIFQSAIELLGDIKLPHLERFAVRTGGLGKRALESIAAATWPNLSDLEVWFGSSHYGATGEIGDALSILTGSNLPRLRALGLKNAEFTDAICAALPEAKILPQLKRLDLSMGIMTRAGADALIQNRTALSHLKQLDVSANHLDSDTVAELQAALPFVTSKSQKDPEPGYRYVSVGE